jgi:hypothetical protein
MLKNYNPILDIKFDEAEFIYLDSLIVPMKTNLCAAE